MSETTHPVRLTKAELWALWQGFEASILDPDETNKAERSAIRKITDAYERARIAEASK